MPKSSSITSKTKNAKLGELLVKRKELLLEAIQGEIKDRDYNKFIRELEEEIADYERICLNGITELLAIDQERKDALTAATPDLELAKQKTSIIESLEDDGTEVIKLEAVRVAAHTARNAATTNNSDADAQTVLNQEAARLAAEQQIADQTTARDNARTARNAAANNSDADAQTVINQDAARVAAVALKDALKPNIENQAKELIKDNKIKLEIAASAKKLSETDKRTAPITDFKEQIDKLSAALSEGIKKDLVGVSSEVADDGASDTSEAKAENEVHKNKEYRVDNASAGSVSTGLKTKAFGIQALPTTAGTPSTVDVQVIEVKSLVTNDKSVAYKAAKGEQKSLWGRIRANSGQISHKKVWGEGGNRGNKFRVIQGVYGENAKELQENVNKTFELIISKLATEHKLDKDQVLLLIQTAKEKGGISNQFDLERKKYAQGDKDLKIEGVDLAKAKKFSGDFQRECQDCGIYTGRTGIDVKPVGLRLAYLPDGLVDELKSKALPAKDDKKLKETKIKALAASDFKAVTRTI